MLSDTPQEIHKILKLGEYAHLVSSDHGHKKQEEPHTQPSHMSAEATLQTLEHEISQIKVEPSWLKGLLIYPVIFIVAFGFFYGVLNFSAIVAQIQGFFSKPQDEQILGDNLDEYYKWISNYYYAVQDKNLLDPNNDIDKDGLSNLDEFTVKTNPIVADSDSDSFSDGIEIINGQNPWGLGSLTPAQRELVSKLDMVMVNNRIGSNVAQTSGSVSGAQTSNFDLTRPGRLSIPRLNLSVPLVWSTDPANFENDLSQGVIHYPGTALPGQIGTIYVSGHSSDYIWKRNQYHSVFAKLNFLKAGDDVFIDVYKTDGSIANFRYQVTGSNTYRPDDQTQFIDNSTSKLNLSTCWPIGTQKDRLVVSAVAVGL